MKKSTVITLLACIMFAGALNAQKAGSSSSGEPVSNTKKGWPSKERHDFITTCVENAMGPSMSEDSARYYCYCMQEKMEAKYPTVEEAATITQEQMESEPWISEIKACLFGYWSSVNRKTFMQDCVGAAAKSLGEEKATSYCECIMFQIEKRYPSFDEANKLTEKDFASPMWKKIIQASLDF